MATVRLLTLHSCSLCWKKSLCFIFIAILGGDSRSKRSKTRICLFPWIFTHFVTTGIIFPLRGSSFLDLSTKADSWWQKSDKRFHNRLTHYLWPRQRKLFVFICRGILNWAWNLHKMNCWAHGTFMNQTTRLYSELVIPQLCIMRFELMFLILVHKIVQMHERDHYFSAQNFELRWRRTSIRPLMSESLSYCTLQQPRLFTFETFIHIN